LKQFANHWGTEFLLKECFNNSFNYQQKQTNQLPTSTSANLNTTQHPPNSTVRVNTNCDNSYLDGMQNDNARKAALRKAALQRAVARHAAKRKADTDEDEETPFNDGETEPEDISDDLRKVIEREEIGVPGKSLHRFPHVS
jgi:hypothetical protein